LAAAKLTDKQKRFCEEYLIDSNATQAYIRAGYSENGAKESACKLLTNSNIQTLLSELRSKQERRTQITADKIIQEFALMAFEELTKETRFSKLKALESLAKIKGLYEADNKQKQPNINLQFVLGTTNLQPYLSDSQNRMVGKNN